MSDSSRRPIDELRAEIAQAFGGDLDPLASFASTFEELPIDPFELFLIEALDPQNPAPDTRRAYERLISNWRAHMTKEGRHPACPSEYHVKSFVDHCIQIRGNQPDTARTKCFRLSKVFEYWQADPVFPHSLAFNPFKIVLSTYDLSRPPGKRPPRIPIKELANVIQSITHIRDRAIVVTQLKLGLRATELCNLRLEDVHLDDRDLNRGYPELGTSSRLDGRLNAVYILSRFERAGNKSRRPRVLPIDDELQGLLKQHLLTRPDSGHPWVFQSKTTHSQLDDEGVNDIWTNAFHPAYEETER